MLLQIGLIFLGIVALMLIGLPVGLCFGAGAIILLPLAGIAPQWAMSQSFHLLSSFAFLCLPLYILLGTTLGFSGMARRISDFASNLVGWVRGGLGVAIIIANAMFGAMSGSALAALAGIGKAFLPDMERGGYPSSYAIAILIPSAVLSCLIPPSGFMIVFGFMGRLSIAKCFLAGVIPGLILMFFLSVIHLVLCRNIPTIHVPPKISFGKRVVGMSKSVYRNFLTLLIPIIVLGVIYGGFGTPTESAAIGTVYAAILALFVYRTLTLRQGARVLTETSKLVGSILILFFFFIVLSRVLIIEQVSDALLDLMMTISTNKWVLMGMLNILMLFMGMIMDDASTTIIGSVILLPVAVSIGFNPYHFVAIACVNLELGLITPPVAPLLYLGGRLAGDMPLSQYIKPVLWFILFGFLPTLLLVLFIPGLSTFLPQLFARGG